MYPTRNLQAVKKQNERWALLVWKLSSLHIREALLLSLMDNIAHLIHFRPLSMSLQSQIPCDLLCGI